jgi:hypothetical protein
LCYRLHSSADFWYVISSNCYLFQIEILPRDDDLIGLLHEIHSSNITGHGYRGYNIMGAPTPVREVAVSCVAPALNNVQIP